MGIQTNIPGIPIDEAAFSAGGVMFGDGTGVPTSNPNSLFWDSANLGFSVGGNVTPTGGIGRTGILIQGPNASVAGPYLQCLTATDNKPLFTILPYQHDLVELWFDTYGDAGLANYVSASVNNNFIVVKNASGFEIDYAAGVASGTTIGALLTPAFGIKAKGTFTNINALVSIPTRMNIGLGLNSITDVARRRLDVLDASNPQIRFSQADTTIYGEFQCNGSGNVTLGLTGTFFGAASNGAWDIGDAAKAARPQDIYCNRNFIGVTSLQMGTNPAAAGVIRLPNNLAINFRNAANNADVQGLFVDTTNNVNIGPFFVESSTGSISLGTNAAATGIIRTPNATGINARNAANNADIQLIASNASNSVLVGFNAVFDSAGHFSVGTNPAASGFIRMPNNQAMNWRNAANSGDIQALYVDGSNQVTLSTGGQSCRIGDNATGKLSFFAAAVVSQQTASGASGYADSGATVVHSAGTFTGGVGATAYTIGDVVAALKNYGLLVS